jgi:hypothetical protein
MVVSSLGGSLPSTSAFNLRSIRGCNRRCARTSMSLFTLPPRFKSKASSNAEATLNGSLIREGTGESEKVDKRISNKQYPHNIPQKLK